MKKNTGQSPVRNQKLRNIRKAQGVTQAEIAEYLGMSRESYQYLETKGQLTVSILVKLAAYFNCALEDLIEDHEFPTAPPPKRDKPDHPSKLSSDEINLLKLYKRLTAKKKRSFNDYLDYLSQ